MSGVKVQERPGPSGARIAHNTAWLGAGVFIEGFVGFAISILLARRLGASGLGSIGVGGSVAVVVGVLVTCGTATLGIREVARHPDGARGIARRVALVRGALAIAVVGTLVLLLPWLAEALSLPGPFLLVYGLIGASCVFTTGWALQGLERMAMVAVGTVAERGLFLAALALFVHEADLHLILVPIFELGTHFGRSAFYAFNLLRSSTAGRAGSAALTTEEFLREGVPVAASAFCRSLFSNGGVLLLGFLGSTAQAGLFLVSHKIVLTVALIPDLIQVAAFPATSRLQMQQPARALAIQRDLLRISLALVLPVSAFAGIFAADGLAFLFGASFSDASLALRIVAWALPLAALTGVSRSLLIASGGAGHFLSGAAAGAGVHVVLGLILIPTWGVSGAGFACIGGELAAASFLASRVRSRLGAFPWDRRCWRPILAVGLAALGIPWVVGPWILQVLELGGLYGALALAVGAVRPAELRALFSGAAPDKRDV